MVLDASLLNGQHYKVRIKGKEEKSRQMSSAPNTPWCSSYRKGNLRVNLHYGRQLYLVIWPIDETLARTTTPGQSRPMRNGNEEVTLHSLEFQNWSLTIRYNLESNQGHLF